MGRPGAKSRSTQQQTQYNYFLAGSSRGRVQKAATFNEPPKARSKGYEAVIRCRQRKAAERKMKEDELAKLKELNEKLRKECEEIEKMCGKRQFCTCCYDSQVHQMPQVPVANDTYGYIAYQNSNFTVHQRQGDYLLMDENDPSNRQFGCQGNYNNHLNGQYTDCYNECYQTNYPDFNNYYFE